MNKSEMTSTAPIGFAPTTKDDLGDLMDIVRIMKSSKGIKTVSRLLQKITKDTNIKKERATEILKYIGKNHNS